jgi:endonuclease/exonuclease/phosphatase (EEP) superfamily protein YafD
MFALHLITNQRLYSFVLITSLAVLACTLASLFGRYQFLELATHFRLQYALAASACVILLIVFRSWKLLPVVLSCAALNWAFIVPYYSAAVRRPVDPSSSIHLRVMLANVAWSNRNYGALDAAVTEERADVAVLQEFTEEWQSHLQSFESQYPYSKLVPKPGGSGMAFFSRYPLEEVEVLSLDASTHIALRIRVNVQGTPLSILSLHPPTPVRSDKFSNRNLQFVRAATLMKETAGAKLLIGDLNTTMWSPYFKDLIRDSGLRDARLGFGLQPSWPMPLPAILLIPIDQCLVGSALTVEAFRVGARTGSDHRPLVVDISVPGSAMRASR